jgi:hypothetical protein
MGKTVYPKLLLNVMTKAKSLLSKKKKKKKAFALRGVYEIV